LAILVLVSEGILALAFFAGIRTPFLLIAGTAMVTAFATAGVIAHRRSETTIPCSCFGSSNERLGLGTSARAFLIATTLAVYGISGSVEPQPGDAGGWLTGLVLAMTLLMLARWLLAAPMLLATVTDRRAVANRARTISMSRHDSGDL
jgi:hypothetical protein